MGDHLLRWISKRMVEIMIRSAWARAWEKAI
jgi:hypothetical protein